MRSAHTKPDLPTVCQLLQFGSKQPERFQEHRPVHFVQMPGMHALGMEVERVRHIGDACRLAEGMSYKNALADLPFGGGKSVIRRPAGGFDRENGFTRSGAQSMR